MHWFGGLWLLPNNGVSSVIMQVLDIAQPRVLTPAGQQDGMNRHFRFYRRDAAARSRRFNTKGVTPAIKVRTVPADAVTTRGMGVPSASRP